MMAILRKELRSLLRERRGFMVPVIYALVLGLVAWLYLSAIFRRETTPVTLGKTLAGTIAAMQTMAVVLFSPLIGASMISGERERGTWARLLSSRVSRNGIVLGKFAAAWLYLILLLTISFPLATLSLLYGGLDLITLAGLFLTQAWLAAALIAIGLAISVGFNRTWAASFLSLGTVLSLVVGLPAITAGIQFRMRTTFPGSVYAAADEHRGEVMQRIAGWFNPIEGVQLFFGLAHGQRIDWIAHYTAMFALGGLSLAIAMLRVRRATA